MPNRLASEPSPYLQQHADNPVDWRPWGDEAFEEARRRDVPVFLSIGYSTCHWCHVMAHESFEDGEVARRMNEAFVCVKVDREERPDVDDLYMTVCQMMTGSGGWPLTVLLTPDKEPFFAGTYFPKQSRHGRMGMLDLVPRVTDLWRTRRADLVAQAKEIVSHLSHAPPPADGDPSGAWTDAAVADLARRFDAEHGGFGRRPKFPTPHNLLLLLRVWDRTREPGLLRRVERTLDAMRRGGIHDHVGGGFHRYSTDERWLLPHFEKMLYDQALLALAYTEAFRATGTMQWADTARDVLEYLLRDMTVRPPAESIGVVHVAHPMHAPRAARTTQPAHAAQATRTTPAPRTTPTTNAMEATRVTDAAGIAATGDFAFASAEDADSEGVEGKFYVWTDDELRAVLARAATSAEPGVPAAVGGGAFADTFSRAYGVRPDGNFREEATGHATGENVLHLPRPVDDVAREAGMSAAELEALLARGRAALKAARDLRVRPLRDDKVLTDWNGLAIAAFARAGALLDEPRYVDAARRAASFVADHLRDARGLLHRYRNGVVDGQSFLDDHAFLAWGLLELHAASQETRWLAAAADVVDAMQRRFADPAGGYFLTPIDGERLLVRQKGGHDGAVPSGTSVAAYVLARLARITGDETYGALCDAAIRSSGGQAQAAPSAFTFLMLGLEERLRPARELVVVGELDDPRTGALLSCFRHLGPGDVAMHKTSRNAADLARHAPWTEPLTERGGPTAYLCVDRACHAPTADAGRLRAALKERADALPAGAGHLRQDGAGEPLSSRL